MRLLGHAPAAAKVVLKKVSTARPAPLPARNVAPSRPRGPPAVALPGRLVSPSRESALALRGR
jgi:hypothetical protein